MDLLADRGAVFSSDEILRWTLWRIWDARKGMATWMALNPSTATARRNDPSVHRMVSFSRRWGYGGMMLVNAYPYRSSSPTACRKWSRWEGRGPDWLARDSLTENLQIIETEARRASLRVVAFGGGIWDSDWLALCLEAFGQPSAVGADERLYCLGMTAAGWPKHPMARGRHRVPDDQQPVLWRSPLQ